ncbi:MAG TPA: glycosyltransferase family 2 protein [Planctomycetaceae bacterium]|nr:glycosyltransferase family 2 protein [Planctomycetaceae bacterium]
MTFPKIAAIIINYKTPGLTLDCLASLQAEISDLPGSQAIVVDNASDDDSVAILGREIKARSWENWVGLAQSTLNAGFSAGNNFGIAAARESAFDGFLLANSDTVVHRGALRHLCAALWNAPTTGLVGPRLEWPSGEVQASCFRCISPLSELAAAAKTGVLSRLVRGDLPIPVDPNNGTVTESVEWISFACVLIRAEVFAAVGPMDEGFFMYYEDVDYCRRARLAGWKIAYAPEARVVHLRGGRTPDEFAQEERRRRPRFYYESRSRYLAKYYGRTGPLQANVCWTLGRGISLVRELAAQKSPHTVAREAGDIWTGSLCGFSRRFTNQPCVQA